MAWLVRWTFADLCSAHSTWRWLGEPSDEGNVAGGRISIFRIVPAPRVAVRRSYSRCISCSGG